MELEKKTTVRTEVLLDTLDALADNCNFFACKGSIFPPLHQVTCRNCRASWEIKMVILGYAKDEMEHIEQLYEKEYWRIWRMQDKCSHDQIIDDDMFEKPCPDCHKEWGDSDSDELSILGVIMREQKPIHDSVDLIISLLEETNCDPDQRIKDLI